MQKPTPFEWAFVLLEVPIATIHAMRKQALKVGLALARTRALRRRQIRLTLSWMAMFISAFGIRDQGFGKTGIKFFLDSFSEVA